MTFIKNSWNAENKNSPKNIFSVEKWKIAYRPKRVLPKFRADPSFVPGGERPFKVFKKIENPE